MIIIKKDWKWKKSNSNFKNKQKCSFIFCLKHYFLFRIREHKTHLEFQKLFSKITKEKIYCNHLPIGPPPITELEIMPKFIILFI